MKEAELAGVKAQVNDKVHVIILSGGENPLAKGSGTMFMNGNSIHLKMLLFTALTECFKKKSMDGYFTAAEIAAGMDMLNEVVGPDIKVTVSYKGKELKYDPELDKKSPEELMLMLLEKALNNIISKTKEGKDDEKDS